MGQHMRYSSYSHGTQKILGMLTAEKTAEIENDSSLYTTLYPNQGHQKTVKKIFWKYRVISQPKYFFPVIIMQLLHPLSPFLQYGSQTVFT
jgi:hypothetical protein